MASRDELIKELGERFGFYRAEWLRGEVFTFFTRPAYFPVLETARPCVLLGGRGTGKTTVLRSLSYEGRFASGQSDPARIASWSYVGLYHKVNINIVNAFWGSGLDKAVWEKLFGHYMNLLFVGQLMTFLHWHEKQCPAAETLSAEACRRISISLRLNESTSVKALIEAMRTGRIVFEAYLNNLDATNLPDISLASAPVNLAIEEILELAPLAGKSFFFLIDEYENFRDYQQIVINTLIKQSGEGYTFKIGVKEFGWVDHSTLNPDQQLISPADYVLIDIDKELNGDIFGDFAREVCSKRIERLSTDYAPLTIEKLLPPLSEEDEARLLGVDERAAEIRKALAKKDAKLEQRARALDDLEVFFIDFLARSREGNFAALLDERDSEPAKWKDRINNHRYASLFTIRSGRSGIRKYYAGWDTLVLLASTNIRNLMELVAETLRLHLQNDGRFDQPVLPRIQTEAAQNIGRKNLVELEGMSRHGGQLVKLVLALGEVFQNLAASPWGHTPEVNHFHLPEHEFVQPEAGDLIEAAVMHMALVRRTANKQERIELKGHDYALHPIFSPYFVFSHRKKRKMNLEADQLLSLVKRPTETIRAILSSHNRDDSAPTQFALFGNADAGDR
jgi:hypothetical protein